MEKPMSRFTVQHAWLCSLALAAAAFAGPTQATTSCADLVTLKIPASEIGLVSGGATISSAAIATLPADPATPDIKAAYCKVLGAVQPVDPNAPPVNFQVN